MMAATKLYVWVSTDLMTGPLHHPCPQQYAVAGLIDCHTLSARVLLVVEESLHAEEQPLW